VLDEALRRLATAGDHDHDVAANAHMILGMATLAHGHTDQALVLFTDLQRHCRSRGERWWLGNALNGAALAALACGDATLAEQHLHESLPIRMSLGDQLGIAMSMETLAWTAAATNDHARVARLAGAAHRRWRDVGTLLFAAPYLLRGHHQCETEARRSLGNRRYTAEFRRGTRLADRTALSYAVHAAAEQLPGASARRGPE
jgi:hypothetical protein